MSNLYKLACGDMQRIDDSLDKLIKIQALQKESVNTDLDKFSHYVKIETDLANSIAITFRAYKSKIQILQKYNYLFDDEHEDLYKNILEKKRYSDSCRKVILDEVKNQKKHSLNMIDKLRNRKRLGTKTMFSVEPSYLNIVSE